MTLILNERYPGRYNNPSPDYPQGSFKNRTTPTAKDGSYLEQDLANDKLAFFASLLSGAGFTANGSVDKVGACQTYDALVQIIRSQNSDTLNAAIANIAAAGTINLTTGAAATSQISISGSGVNISGFTVAANRFFVVKFTGANTLVNSASLVTNEGANILTAAGDSCVLRAVAANTVEVLLYRKAKASSTAWVRFNGTGTPAIADSLNVSSITDNGVGDYTVNFLSPMNNPNYALSASAIAFAAVNSSIVSIKFGTTPSTSGFTIRVGNLANGAPASAAYQDVEIINCVVMGGK